MFHNLINGNLKKRAAIFLLLLAGIFILAHSFIPHTHHQDHICIINSPCYNQQASLHSSNWPDENGNGHNHHNKENDSRPLAEAYDKGHNHQSAEITGAYIQSCSDKNRKSDGDQETDEIQTNEPQSDITDPALADDNEARCHYRMHDPIAVDDHTHDGHCQTEGCVLFEILVYDPLARKPVIDCPCTDNDHNHSELVQAILQAGFKPPAGRDNLHFRQKPYKDTYSGHNHSLIPGLRAPPVC